MALKDKERLRNYQRPLEIKKTRHINATWFENWDQKRTSVEKSE